jgi:hAT family dimerisation domain.
LQLYLLLPTLDGQIKPLQWWEMNELQYPRLARMARDYLAITATSVPSEQSFSLSKNLITCNRNRLLGKMIRACMCLKSWWASSITDMD